MNWSWNPQTKKAVVSSQNPLCRLAWCSAWPRVLGVLLLERRLARARQRRRQRDQERRHPRHHEDRSHPAVGVDHMLVDRHDDELSRRRRAGDQPEPETPLVLARDAPDDREQQGEAARSHADAADHASRPEHAGGRRRVRHQNEGERVEERPGQQDLDRAPLVGDGADERADQPDHQAVGREGDGQLLAPPAEPVGDRAQQQAERLADAPGEQHHGHRRDQDEDRPPPERCRGHRRAVSVRRRPGRR